MVISENRRLNMTTLHRADFTGQGAPLLNFFIDRYAKGFAAEIDAVIDAAEKGVAPEVDFDDGRQALVLAEAALMSVIDGRSVKSSEIG